MIYGRNDENKRIDRKKDSRIKKSKRTSQEKIAEKADISPPYLSRIECGRENPTLDMLIKLSNALEVEIWEMFDFGHVKGHKDIKGTLQNFIKTADEPTLHLALKVLRAVSR